MRGYAQAAVVYPAGRNSGFADDPSRACLYPLNDRLCTENPVKLASIG